MAVNLADRSAVMCEQTPKTAVKNYFYFGDSLGGSSHVLIEVGSGCASVTCFGRGDLVSVREC